MAEYIEKAELIKKLCFETAEWYYSPTIKTIKEFPVADVQPVEHSRWIPMNDGTYNAYCENCGHERGSKAWNKADYKYCPNCGARMDAEPDEPWQSE